MKNIKNLQQKIYAIFKKKLHIFSSVSGQFKNRQYNDHRDIDWYYQESWFDRKWFNHKLKRFIMEKFIYPLFEKSLQKYFVEIEFYSPETKLTDEYNKKHETEYEGDFRLYLPILVQVKHQSQAIKIMNIVANTLRKEYGIDKFRLLRIDENPLSKERFDLIIERLNNEYRGRHKSKLEIVTHIPDNFGNYNFDEPKITEIDIKIIKLTDVSWINKTDYTVLIRRTTSNEE
jgi:hypothetical protein